MPRPSSVNLPRELHQQARAAIRIVRRETGRNYSLNQFITEAVTAQIKLISDTYNDGRPLYPDERPLEPGRAN